MLNSLSIRYKLSGIIAGSLLISIIVTTLVSSNTMRDLVSSRINQQELPLTLSNVAYGVAQELQQAVITSKAMANNTLLEPANDDAQRLNAITKYLAHTKQKTNGITAFYVHGATGDYYTGDGLSRQLSPNSNNDQWFYRFINSDKEYSLDIDIDENVGIPTLFINYRTHDGDSIAGIGMSMPKVSQFIKSFTFGESGYAFLTDADGKITVHPNANLAKNATTTSIFGEEAQRLLSKTDVNIIPLQQHGLIVGAKYIAELNWYAIIALPTSEVYQPITKATFSLVIISLFVAIVLIAVGLWLALTVSRPIGRASSMLGDIASGDADLTKKLRVDSEDEVGQLSQSFNNFTDQLQDIVKGVSSNAIQIADISNQLSTSSNNTQGNIAQQHRSIDMIATAATQMAASIREIAQNAQCTADAAQQSIVESKNGQGVVQDTISRITSVHKEIDTANSVIETLANDIGEISNILTVISGISEQTNLLALNAAIEAARAGEQGRGFAVVADEVRTLAQRTQESTEQISGMIKRLQQGAEGAVNAMSSGLTIAQETVSHADQAGASLENIVETINQISDLGIQVATATEEQATVVEELNTHIVDIKTISEQTTQESEAITESCHSLSGSSNGLNDLIGNFKV